MTVGATVDEWDWDEIHMYSDAKVKIIKDRLESYPAYATSVQLYEVNQPISSKDLVRIIPNKNPELIYILHDA